MAFDGITIHSLVFELSDKLTDGRIVKIAQPEKDALLLQIKTHSGEAGRKQYRLLLSANASLPLIYLTQENKPSPLTAPNFCMLLRKHLNNCRIVSITQVGMERVVKMELEHRDELGDLCTKYLYVELMGKHSNIIFTDDSDMILDSIKHVSGLVSSVREVLPGRQYFIPGMEEKHNPLEITQEEFLETVCGKPLPIFKALYTSLTGFSPAMANEVCHQAMFTPTDSMQSLSEDLKLHLYHTFARIMEDVRENRFTPAILFHDDEPVEFYVLPVTVSTQTSLQEFSSVSELLETYYSARDVHARIRQKSADLRKIVSTALERTVKKYDLQRRQLKDTEKRDKYKVYGELLNTYGYSCEPGAKSLTCENYYTSKEITIPLDDTMDAAANAKRYFEKYNKLKRTFDALTKQIAETESDITHLESIRTSLDIARQEADLGAIKEELVQYGYIKKHSGGKKEKNPAKSKPLHYISSDGYHMYVGKNNFQNDELTFHFADGGDWWFHAKGMTGSHVIVKTRGEELPDRTFEEAAKLAGYYSSGKDAPKVEIDYIEKKHVKKPNGSKPGFVVYYTNYSMIIKPDIDGIEEIK